MFLTEFKVRNKYCIHNMGLAVLPFFFQFSCPNQLDSSFHQHEMECESFQSRE